MNSLAIDMEAFYANTFLRTRTRATPLRAMVVAWPARQLATNTRT